MLTQNLRSTQINADKFAHNPCCMACLCCMDGSSLTRGGVDCWQREK